MAKKRYRVPPPSAPYDVAPPTATYPVPGPTAPYEVPAPDCVPRFTHDCINCVFLGTFEEYDLYYCAQNGHPTVIGRWGSEGPEYTSGMVFADKGIIPCLVEAKRRAVERKLIVLVKGSA